MNPLAKHEFEVSCLPCGYVGEFYEAPFHIQTLSVPLVISVMLNGLHYSTAQNKATK